MVRGSRPSTSGRSSCLILGGVDLLDDAVLILTPGHRYGLIGRNGKGKSTLLKFLASRRVGGLDNSISVHYVTQEVSLTPAQENQLPHEVVLSADIERRLLLAEVAEMEEQETNELNNKSGTKKTSAFDEQKDERNSPNGTNS